MEWELWFIGWGFTLGLIPDIPDKKKDYGSGPMLLMSLVCIVVWPLILGCMVREVIGDKQAGKE